MIFNISIELSPWRLCEALEPFRYLTDDVNEEVVAVVVAPSPPDALVATESSVRRSWTHVDLRTRSHLDDLQEDFVWKGLHCQGDLFPKGS